MPVLHARSCPFPGSSRLYFRPHDESPKRQILPSIRTNSDPAEIAKFEAAAHRFWDVDGEFKPLHKLNPVRARYVQERAHAARRARARRGLRRWIARRIAGARGRHGHGHRPRAEHGRHRAPARARIRPRPSTIAWNRPKACSARTPETSTSSPAWKCSSTCRTRPPRWQCSARWCAPAAHLFISTINRNLKSFALAIVGAEYLARLVPRGTHEYERLLKPSEIARFARAAGLEVADIAGLNYDPLREQCSLTRDPSVNYLMHLTRATPPTDAPRSNAPIKACCSTSTARCSTPRRT